MKNSTSADLLFSLKGKALVVGLYSLEFFRLRGHSPVIGGQVAFYFCEATSSINVLITLSKFFGTMRNCHFTSGGQTGKNQRKASQNSKRPSEL